MRKTSVAFGFIWALVFLCNIPIGRSQNIVPNPSFETYTSCPYWVTQIYFADPWESATNRTPDYFNVCTDFPWVDVPLNAFGYQEAHTGVAYAGAQYHGNPFGNREYIMVPLIEPLEANYTYEVSFWVSLADEFCGTSEFGVYFSQDEPGPPAMFGVLNVVPQIKSTLGFISDTASWVNITGCFIPDGGELFMTIGNFVPEHLTPIDSNCTVPMDSFNYLDSYYFMDDFSVIKGLPPEEFNFDLGGPVYPCESYTIDPGISNALYQWGDGSEDSTLFVTESGIYSVTITLGCTQGTGEIEVIFHGEEEVELGPDEITICENEPYVISLDPGGNNYTWQDGSTSAEYTITNPGLYIVTLDDGCQLSYDAIQVNVIGPPEPFSFGEDTYVCPNEQIEFDFDFTIGEFLWQDGSTDSHISITEPGNYSLTITNMCGSYSDDILVSAFYPPVFDLGPDSIILCEGLSYDIQLDPAIGDILWQDGSDLGSYSITSPGTYSVTVTNFCGSVIQDIEVFPGAAIPLELGADKAICPAQLPFVLDISGLGGIDSFLWQDGSASSMFNVTSGGSYSVTVNDGCTTAYDSITISIENDFPGVMLPEDIMLCMGESLILDGGGISGEYVWQDSSNADSFLVTMSGIYSLTVSNACGTGSDSVSIQFSEIPLPPSLGPDLTLCPGESQILYANVSAVNYAWQDNTTEDSIIISSAGSYWLEISNMCGSASDTIEVIVNDDPPDVDLLSSFNLCAGQTLLIDAGISGVDYLWNTGSQFSSITVTDPGLYSITVSNSCGTDIDSIIINDGGPAPLITFPDQLSICAGETILLTPVSSNVLSWLWHDGSTNSFFEVDGADLLTVQASNDCGVSYDTLQVDLLPAVPMLDLGSNVSLCPGEILNLSIDLDDVEITWSDGTTGNSIDVMGESLIFAMIENQCGSSVDSIEIIYLPPVPFFDLGNDQALCPGETITISPGINNVEYLWHDGSALQFLETTLPGLITLTLTNECGSSTDSLLIIEDLNGPDVDLGEDIVACKGDVISIDAGISGVDYLWQDGSTGPQLTTSVSGEYILHVSNACGNDIDTVLVNLDIVLPAPSLGFDTVLCDNEVLLLESNATPLTSVQWQDGSTAVSFSVTSAGRYILSEHNVCGDASDTIIVSHKESPPLFDIGADTTICSGQFIILNAPVTTSQILWQDGSNNSSIVADKSQTYSLFLINDCGTSSDAFSLTIKDCDTHSGIFIPNVFSPGGSSNKQWSIFYGDGIDIRRIQCSIFDRWGNMVMQSNSLTPSWDGNFNTKECPSGVYLYTFQIEYMERGKAISTILSGDITLIR